MQKKHFILYLGFLWIAGILYGEGPDFFLTWDTDPTREVTIQSLSHNKVAPQIEYREENNENWSKELPGKTQSFSANLFLHQALVKNLHPDSSYRIRSVGKRWTTTTPLQDPKQPRRPNLP